jgi:hypothetical protein
VAKLRSESLKSGVRFKLTRNSALLSLKPSLQIKCKLLKSFLGKKKIKTLLLSIKL